MGKTMIEKILGSHAGQEVSPEDIVDVSIDVRVARDFGGANVVQHLEEKGLPVHNPRRTYFTFDCNPGGSDQKYATNQHLCRLFARKQGIQVFDIDRGIGTHLAIDRGLVVPGETFVSTDSHANILGAIGAFGQGMGDQDIAHAFAYGKVWFKVPPTVKIFLKGKPSKEGQAKDIVLALLRELGASGLLGYAAEFDGPLVPFLSLSERITISSMATEMGGIIALFPPNQEVMDYCSRMSGRTFETPQADGDAHYERVIEISLEGLHPLISLPGHPEDVVEVSSLIGKKIDSAFIGSCTGGRLEDMEKAAEILRGRKVAPGVVLKIVPATNEIWQQCLKGGLIEIFKDAGALVSNAGCAGCAAGQIGQSGPGEVTISTGNRNFAGKQGKGDVYLASPSTVAASAVAGVITQADQIPREPVFFSLPDPVIQIVDETPKEEEIKRRPGSFTGKIWVIKKDHIDTDMIFHNSHLAITDLEEMGQHTFGNLEGWRDFAEKAHPGDMVITGKNFGCGSSRQQGVDCFKSLGISLIIAQSFGAIYERNAINAGFPLLWGEATHFETGQRVEVHLESGRIKNLDTGEEVEAEAFSEVQMKIYQKGGLL